MITLGTSVTVPGEDPDRTIVVVGIDGPLAWLRVGIEPLAFHITAPLASLTERPTGRQAPPPVGVDELPLLVDRCANCGHLVALHNNDNEYGMECRIDGCDCSDWPIR